MTVADRNVMGDGDLCTGVNAKALDVVADDSSSIAQKPVQWRNLSQRFRRVDVMAAMSLVLIGSSGSCDDGSLSRS
jgi:hypothetical protein